MNFDLADTSSDIAMAMTFPELQDVLFTQIMNMSMAQGVHNIEVFTKNVLNIPGDSVFYNFTLFMDKPEVHGKCSITLPCSWTN